MQGRQEALYWAEPRGFLRSLCAPAPRPGMDAGPATGALRSPGLDMGQKELLFSLLLEGDVLTTGVPAGERNPARPSPAQCGAAIPSSQRRHPALSPPGGQVARGGCLSVSAPP